MYLKEESRQEIYLELIRRLQFGDVPGHEISEILLNTRTLWSAAVVDGLAQERLDLGKAYIFSRLLALSHDRLKGFDTLYLLADNREMAETLCSKFDRAFRKDIIPLSKLRDGRSLSPEGNLIRLWWDESLFDDNDPLIPPPALGRVQTPSFHDSLLLLAAPDQNLFLEELRRRDFNAYDGQVVFESLLEHRSRWSAVMMHCLASAYLDQFDSLMLRKLIAVQRNQMGPENTLYILANSRADAEFLAAQSWVESPSILGPGSLGSFSSLPSPQCVLKVWWD